MKATELKNGAKVLHVKYGREYKIVSGNMRMKDSEKGWIDAVTYAPLYENEFEMFTREKESFLKEFELI